ncbi:DUF3514 domain-containing protein [Ehrlichia sp. JZT12]
MWQSRSKKENKVAGPLYPLRSMHFAYCTKVLKRTFYIKNDVLCVRPDVVLDVLSIDKECEFILFVIKLSLLAHYSIVLNISGVAYSLFFNATHYLNQNTLDSVLLKIARVLQYDMCMDSYLQNIKTVFAVHEDQLKSSSEIHYYSEEFYARLLDACCSFTMARVTCHQLSAEVMNFFIVNSAIMFGAMYKQLKFIGDIPNTSVQVNQRFREIIGIDRKYMGGDLGETCYKFFNEFMCCYNPYVSRVWKIAEGFYMSRSFLKKGSPYLRCIIESNIQQNTMDYDVIIKDFAGVLARRIDRNSMWECMTDTQEYGKRMKNLERESNNQSAVQGRC